MFNYLFSTTKIKDFYNYVFGDDAFPQSYYYDFITQAFVKDGIHVGNKIFSDQSGQVSQHLQADITMSTANWMATLLDAGHRVMFYVGNLDICICYRNTDKFLRQLEWSGKVEFNAVRKQIWRLDGEVAGYARVVEPLLHVAVHASGHTVPRDQPERSLDMINKFITKQSFGS